MADEYENGWLLFLAIDIDTARSEEMSHEYWKRLSEGQKAWYQRVALKYEELRVREARNG